jgi:NIPSNAP
VIYQHRLVTARGGRLEDRHAEFQRVAMTALDDHGSKLVGAWEIWIGGDAGAAIWQLREHESLATWEQHRAKAMADAALRSRQDATLYPTLDFVDTSILCLTDFSPGFPKDWPLFDAVRGKARGFIEQRIIYMRPEQPAAHHALYREEIMPALEREGASLIAFFDTVIGPGTTNTGSHRSVELRRFPDMAAWQRWREAQDSDAALSQTVKRAWLGAVARIDSTILRPMDYSRIR